LAPSWRVLAERSRYASPSRTQRRAPGIGDARIQKSEIFALFGKLPKRAERKYQRSASKVRLFASFKYKANSWDKKRRVIAKAEYGNRGANPGYVYKPCRSFPSSL
jgi:hypothetical protein